MADIVSGNNQTDQILQSQAVDENPDKRPFRSRLNSEVEAGECWRAAVNLPSLCFFRQDMEKAGIA